MIPGWETRSGRHERCPAPPLVVHFDDGEPCIRDVDLAQALALAKPRNIRETIKANLEFLPALHVRPRAGRTSMPQGGEREDVVEEFWLTAQDALFAASQRRSTWPPCLPTDRARVDADCL